MARCSRSSRLTREPGRTALRRASTLEADYGPDRELGLRQPRLTETERIAEITAVFVVQRGRLETDVRTYADVAPREVVEAASVINRQLGFRLQIVGAEKR